MDKKTDTPKKKFKWQEEREAFVNIVVDQMQKGKVIF